MPSSLLFLPDISGYTKFVQTTEIEHSQHVIAELLEVLLEANTEDLRLAEVEGDALFFYKQGEIPSQERLLAQIETMFTAFYSHLKLLEKNRICPCNACATAPDLKLKIIAHSGEIQFLEVGGTSKPFGKQVIEVHRLLKNSVDSDNYVLISADLATAIGLPIAYESRLFSFKIGQDNYDSKPLDYIYALIDRSMLNLSDSTAGNKVVFDRKPDYQYYKEFFVKAEDLLEFISNYSYRHEWVKGVDEFRFNKNEVTRLGTEHLCVINNKHLNFVAVTKDSEKGNLVYGEMTKQLPIADRLYQFFIITPISETLSGITVEVYRESESYFKKLLWSLFGKRVIKGNILKSLTLLHKMVKNIPEYSS